MTHSNAIGKIREAAETAIEWHAADASQYYKAINEAITVLSEHFFTVEPEGILQEADGAPAMLAQCVESVLAQHRAAVEHLREELGAAKRAALELIKINGELHRALEVASTEGDTHKPDCRNCFDPLCLESPDGNHHSTPIGSGEEWIPTRVRCWYCGEPQAVPPEEMRGFSDAR